MSGVEVELQASFQQINLITKQNIKGEVQQFPLVPLSTKKQEPKLEKASEDEKVRVKSVGRKIAIGLIISLSAVMFGYSIKEITSIPMSQLSEHYNITISYDNALSILNAALPLAAIIGAVITKVLMKRFRRLSGIYVFTIVNCAAIALVNVNTFLTLIIGRILQGVCIGFYAAIAPIYLKEIAPRQLRKMLGLFFSLGKVVGVLLVIAVQFIVRGIGINYDYRIILSMTAVLSILQAILIFFFGSDTPTEMIEKGKHHKAKQIIQKLYKQDYVEEVLKEYTQDYEVTQNADVKSQSSSASKKNNKTKKKQKKRLGEASIRRKNNGNQENGSNRMQQESKKGEAESSMWQSEFDVRQSSMAPSAAGEEMTVISSEKSEIRPKLSFKEKREKAYCLGFHLASIRNLIGANAIITQGGLFIKDINYGLGRYTSLIINVVQLISVLFGLLYVQGVMGKKPLFLLSIPLLSILNFALTMAMIYSNVLALMLLMCIFMAVYGLGFLSPIWAYPSEVIPASESLPSNILHWVTLAICLLIPPLVKGFNNGNPYPVFIFFGIYGLIGFIHVRSVIRESNGLTFKEIVKSFK